MELRVTWALHTQGPVCARSWVLSLTMQIKRDEDNSKEVGWRERGYRAEGRTGEPHTQSEPLDLSLRTHHTSPQSCEVAKFTLILQMEKQRPERGVANLSVDPGAETLLCPLCSSGSLGDTCQCVPQALSPGLARKACRGQQL